jgi:site-specific DNA-adenine methylase
LYGSTNSSYGIPTIEEPDYKLRSRYNLRASCDNIERAARFIALNRTLIVFTE